MATITKWIIALAVSVTIITGVALALHAAAPGDPVKQEAGNRDKSATNLKQIGIALHGYHHDYQVFPATAIYSTDGKPLYSWRVAILPYVDENDLYKQFKLDEPWDSDNNKKLLAKLPKVYAPLGVKPKEPGQTFYRAIHGKGAAFEGTKGLKLNDFFEDGTSNTILVVEAGEPVPWTKPDELAYDPDKPLPKFGGLFKDGFNAAYADASVRFIKKDIDEKILRAMITRAGREVIAIDP